MGEFLGIIRNLIAWALLLVAILIMTKDGRKRFKKEIWFNLLCLKDGCQERLYMPWPQNGHLYMICEAGHEIPLPLVTKGMDLRWVKD